MIVILFELLGIATLLGIVGFVFSTFSSSGPGALNYNTISTNEDCEECNARDARPGYTTCADCSRDWSY